MNVIFFTLEAGDMDMSVARWGSPAPFRPWAECFQRVAASRRFAFKDLNEGSMVRAAVPKKSVTPRRLSKASARLRRAIVRTIDVLILGSFIRFDTTQESWANA